MKHTRRVFPAALLSALLAVLLLSACGPEQQRAPASPAAAGRLRAARPQRPARQRGDLCRQTHGPVRSGRAPRQQRLCDQRRRGPVDQPRPGRRAGPQRHAGYLCSQRGSGPQRQSDYLVTGQVDEAWLRETSATDLATSLRVNYVLANRQGRLLRESLSSSQSRTGLPSGAAAENLMLETLRDLVKPMAQKIVQTIRPKNNRHDGPAFRACGPCVAAVSGVGRARAG